MSGVLIFGGGEIAEKGIVPVVGGTITGADVLNEKSINNTIQVAEYPDTIINCAGVSHPGDVKSADWVDEINTNLIGSFVLAKRALAYDVETLIFVASVSGLYGKANHAGYCASKAGVISLVQSLAMEGVNAYAISPGRVDTRLRERDYPGEDPRTRLWPTQVGMVVDTILAGGYLPGDNIIIRKRGFDTEMRIDRGEPWFDYLDIGKPSRI